MPDSILTLRRRNLLMQLTLFAKRQLDEGIGTGASTTFAEVIGIHKSLLSRLKGDGGRAGARDISDSLARQIEARLGLPSGWMDQEHGSAPMTSAEESFIALALAAYRRADAKGRRELRRSMRQMSGDGEG